MKPLILLAIIATIQLRVVETCRFLPFDRAVQCLRSDGHRY